MTGATHARELISTNLNVYQMLKLLRLGEIEKNDHWHRLLQDNKYIFMPIFNVDGVNFIEDHWKTDHKILPKRKNMDVNTPCKNIKGEKDLGVDLNRQFEIDFGQIDPIVDYQNDDWGGGKGQGLA